MIAVMKSRSCDSSEDLRKALHWLPIEQRTVFKINLLTYKCPNNEAPKYLQNLLTMSSSANPPVLRSLADCKRDQSGKDLVTGPSKTLLHLFGMIYHLTSGSAPLLTSLKPAYVKLLSIRFVFTLTISALIMNCVKRID